MAAVVASSHEKFRYSSSFNDQTCKQFQRNDSTGELNVCKTCHSSSAYHRLVCKKGSVSNAFLPLLVAFAAVRNVRVTLSTATSDASAALQNELIESLDALKLLQVSATSCISKELNEEAASLRSLLPLQSTKGILR